jgi:hypothetical protein
MLRLRDARQAKIWSGDTPHADRRLLRQHGWSIPEIENKQTACWQSRSSAAKYASKCVIRCLVTYHMKQ